MSLSKSHNAYYDPSARFELEKPLCIKFHWEKNLIQTCHLYYNLGVIGS